MIDLSRPWTSTTLLAIDIEGNGQNPQELIELAIVPIVDGGLQLPGKSWLVRPRSPILPRVERIHGISNAQVAGCPQFAQIADEVLELLGDWPIIGHRVAVDRGVIGAALPKWTACAALDTWAMARSILPDESSYALEFLVGRLGIDNPDDGPRHRALADARATARLFVELCRRLPAGGSASLYNLMRLGIRNGGEANSPQMGMF